MLGYFPEVDFLGGKVYGLERVWINYLNTVQMILDSV